MRNYFLATAQGYDFLTRHDFSDDFFFDIHKALMVGKVRKPKNIGMYRTEQNYIGRNDPSHSITFIPPKPDEVPFLMSNLIGYMNKPEDKFRPLVRTAIIHAQFETIHPFMDGNGRVGRGGRQGHITSHIGFAWAKNFNKSTLQAHVEKHGQQYGADGYAVHAVAFANRVDRVNHISYVRKDGTTVKYSKSTNEFAIVDKYGIVKTYYRPTRGIKEYYNDRRNHK